MSNGTIENDICINFTPSFQNIENIKFSIRDARDKLSPSFHVDITGREFMQECYGCNLENICDYHKAWLTTGSAHICLTGKYLDDIEKTLALSNCVRVIAAV